MKFSLGWLKEYIPTSLSSEAIAHALTSIGIEVDKMESIPISFQGVVVAQVLSTQPHPQAEKLQIAKVSDGTKEYSVVCAASNCREGILTAFAPCGATLQDKEGKPFQIKEVKLRGVPSEGMLCSHDELGLPEDAFSVEDGIMEFDQTCTLGTPVSSLYDDIIYEVSLTPNLAHAANLLGIARELSAVTQEKVHTPTSSLHESSATSPLHLEIQDFSACPLYSCRVIEDIKVGPSPAWLKERLESCGFRSVNNVVDITNYVLLELGHPLHAFDVNTLQGNSIVVRHAKLDEKVIGIDEKEYFPTQDTLLICDAHSPIALAGIMGSKPTEVSEKTTRILLESAYFEPTGIRRSSKRLNLHTEASKRFERGTDPNAVLMALHRATDLLIQYCGGKVTSKILEKSNHPFFPWSIDCRLSQVNRILGTQLAMSEVEDIFKRLGLTVSSIQQDSITVNVPTYRNDLKAEIDLVEEVARIYGYDHLTIRGPLKYQGSTLPHDRLYVFEKEIRSLCLGEGLQEFLTCNLISPHAASVIATDSMPSRFLIHILNPSSSDQSVLRPSLLPNLLEVVKYNVAHETTSLAGFEIGKIHFKTKEAYVEPTVCAILLTGKRSFDHWDVKTGMVDFYDLKGILENFLDGLKIDSAEYVPSSYENFHPGRQASILLNQQEIGVLGEVHPTTLHKMDVNQSVFFAQFILEDLMRASKKEFRMKPLPQFPASVRDWTVTLKETCPISEVLKSIRAHASPLLEDVYLLDIYRSDQLGQDWKNVTFRFVYRDWQQTLSLKAVDSEHSRILSAVAEKQKTV